MLSARGVAVVVPSLTGRTEGVLASVARQLPEPEEVVVVVGVAPSGRARNLGVSRTTAPVLVFVDDDATLVGDDCLARLVAPLADPRTGAVGTAKLLPPGSSPFQRRVARQVPRIEHPVVTTLVDSTPPVGGHGYTGVTTTCCAMRREVIEEIGGFDEGLLRGVDSELFQRLAAAGYRLCIAPRTAVHHPAPATMRALLGKHLLYGVGYAQQVRRHPATAAGRYLHTPLHAGAYVLARSAALPFHVVVPWSWSSPSWRPGFRPLGALAGYAAALGYVYGWYRYGAKAAVVPHRFDPGRRGDMNSRKQR